MLGATVLKDLDLESLLDALPTFTAAGRTALRDRLAAPLTDTVELQKRRAQIVAIRNQCKDGADKAQVITLRNQLREAETDVVSLLDPSEDKRHAEYYTQILWDPKSRFAWLNHLGWLNELIVFLRTIFLPGLSVILPIIVFAAPLVFYNLVLNEPLTAAGYFKLLQTSLKKAMPSVLGKPRFAGTGGIMETGEQFAHVGISIAMFGASIWNQISAALAMRAVVADMRRRADAVKAFAAASAELGRALGIPVSPVAIADDQLGLFGQAWNSPAVIQTLLKDAGQLDMLAAVAFAKKTCFPSVGPTLELTDLYHPAVPRAKRVYNSLAMSSTKSHVLLTGPNRGGKSTLLKSLGTAVLMAQTVGVVFARAATMPVFDNIITALAPQDIVGKMSLFEAEIEFAKEVRGLVGATFLMMDEIFHGTNAHDGVEASQVFLDELYETPVYSVVSTHYMELPVRYASAAQNLCMEASVDPADSDRLIYSYLLRPGVNKFSSVREILRERGLLGVRGSDAKKTTGSASKA